MIHFELPQNNSSIIKIIGVGGGGGNAVNYMYGLGIEGVDFIVCNTDQKALNNSSVPTKIQLGPHLTQGLGAGANPEIGMKACQESVAEIERLLADNTKMVFVTAGMGGGTGTGGAPIVARLAKELGILTVGIVTTPFSYEGKRRMRQAQEGIEALRKSVDTILIISNDKLRQQYGNIPTSQAFSRADDILATAAKCITDVINSQGHIVVDFADVTTVMRDGGVAILGSATASGENRAYEAVENAIKSPLLNDYDIKGAKWVLLNINSAHGVHEHTLDEVEMIQAYIQEQAGDECDVIFGTGFDDNLGDQISVTIIATGFNYNPLDHAYNADKKRPVHEKNKEVYELKSNEDTQTTSFDDVDKNTPQASSPNTNFDPLAPTMFEVEPPAIPGMLAIGMGLSRPWNMKQPESVETPAVSTSEPKVVLSLFDQIDNLNTVEEHSSAPHIENSLLDDTNQLSLQIKEEVTEPTTPSYQATPSVLDELDSLFASSKPDTTHSIQDDYVTIKGITINRRKGNRYLSDSELEAEVNFEIQKRAFEDRASRLRSMSFNVQKADIDADEVNVPAYLRKNQSLDNHPTSADEELSSLQVSNRSAHTGISSLNTFLHGNNPD